MGVVELPAMRIADLYRRDAPVISFEFFPPKTDKGFRNLFHTIEHLKRLDPGFVSVTWGAGGSTRRKTVDLVARIQREIGLLAMAHMTCVGAEPDDIAATLERLEREGIDNVLALRGDAPRGNPDWTPASEYFSYASDLVRFIRERSGACVGAAFHPETHPDAESPEADLAHLVMKVGTGAEFLISNFFFDNQDYYDFVEKARGAGIELPLVPGIMPVISWKNLRKMCSLNGSRVPADLEHALEAAGDDPERTTEVGVTWATEQCRDLLANGAPGIHFYTLNRSPATRQIHANLFGR